MPQFETLVLAVVNVNISEIAILILKLPTYTTTHVWMKMSLVTNLVKVLS